MEVYLEYCFEDGVWHKAQDVTEDTVGAEGSYTLIAQVSCRDILLFASVGMLLLNHLIYT